MAIPLWLYLVGGAIVAGVAALPSIAFPNARKYDAAIDAAAERYGLPRALLYGMIAKESSFNPAARGRDSTAVGLMQVTQGAAADVGVSWAALRDPAKNIMAGAAYLSRMVNEFGIVGGVRAYYEGPGNRRKNSDGNPGNDNVTRALESATYAADVLAYAAAFNVKEGIAWDPIA